MESSVIEEVHNEIVAQLARGNERGAMDYLRSRFSELPEELQGEILTQAYLNAMRERTERMKAVNEIQEQSIAILQALDVLKAEIEKGPKN